MEFLSPRRKRERVGDRNSTVGRFQEESEIETGSKGRTPSRKYSITVQVQEVAKGRQSRQL